MQNLCLTVLLFDCISVSVSFLVLCWFVVVGCWFLSPDLPGAMYNLDWRHTSHTRTIDSHHKFAKRAHNYDTFALIGLLPDTLRFALMLPPNWHVQAAPNRRTSDTTYLCKMKQEMLELIITLWGIIIFRSNTYYI